MSGNIIERWFQASGLSKKHFYRETGIGTSSLTKYITREVEPSTKTIHKILLEINKKGLGFTAKEYYESRKDLSHNAVVILIYCATNNLSISDFEILSSFNSHSVSRWLKGNFHPTRIEKEIMISKTNCDQFEKLKTVDRCPKCNKSVIENDFKFCPLCGFDTTTEVECLSCNTKINPSAKFCVNCGCKTGKSIKNCGEHVPAEEIIPEPGVGITIEFKFSTTMNFELAVDEATKHPSFKKFGDGRKSTYRVNVDEGKILKLLPLIELLSRIRNKIVYVDGVKSSWQDFFGFSWCYSRKQTSYKPEYYCFGFENEYQVNPWGCLHTGISFDKYCQWSKWGGWLNDQGDWKFDKQRIRHELERNLKYYQGCPHINFELISKVIAAIPDIVNPYNDKDWEFVEGRSEDDIGMIFCTTDYYGHERREMMIGVAPRGKAAMKKIMKKVYKDKKLIILTSAI